MHSVLWKLKSSKYIQNSVGSKLQSVLQLSQWRLWSSPPPWEWKTKRPLLVFIQAFFFCAVKLGISQRGRMISVSPSLILSFVHSFISSFLPHPPSFFYIFIFQTGSHTIDQTGLELPTILPRVPGMSLHAWLPFFIFSGPREPWACWIHRHPFHIVWVSVSLVYLVLIYPNTDF